MSKLYATVSSEKASKGQGGQEYVDIELTGSLKQPLAKMRFTQTGTGTYLLHGWTETNRLIHIEL